MKRWLAYLFVWSLGTAATVGACWLGLRSVVEAAAPLRSAPFSAAELDRGAASPELTSPANQPDPVPVAATSPSPTPTTTTPAPTTTTPARTTPPTTEAWVAVSNGRGGTAFTRTFHLQGGDVAIWADPYDVHMINADPRPGYTVMPTRYDNRSLTVSLVSNQRTSRVYVSWRGAPYAEVTEAVG